MGSQVSEAPNAPAEPAPEPAPAGGGGEARPSKDAAAGPDPCTEGSAGEQRGESEGPGEEELEEAKPKEAKPEAVPFSLSELEAEIEQLRADPPPYVCRVGSLTVPPLICDDDGQLVKPSGEGPWDLTLSVCGGSLEEEPEPPRPEEPEELTPEAELKAEKARNLSRQRREAAEAYNFPWQVSLRIDSSWPMQPPSVRFQCIIHHALIDDSNGMLLPFYRTLPRDERKVFTLRLIVQAVHDFLVDPLKCWGIPAESTPQRLVTAIRSNLQMNEQRLDTIRKYAEKAIHKELFTVPPAWKEEWFDAAFWKAQQENTEEAWRACIKEELPGEVFSTRIFTDEFCDMLLEEIFNFYASGLPARRPNSMNNYGIILNEIGLEPFIDQLQRCLQPLGDLLWPGAGSVWDGHHCFIVRYREGEDLGLDMHTDDSDVTFNICLGLEFAGAGLQFCGMMGAANHRKRSYTYHHKKGQCVFHLGRKRHGADDISSGERLNLILWNHSSTYRQSEEYRNPEYKTEEGPPDEVCVSYTHDRDYGIYKEYPKGKEQYKGRGWCPPKPFEYADFKPDSDQIMGA